MKKCDVCSGTGLVNLGGLYPASCPACKGSGWVDDKIAGKPPKKAPPEPPPYVTPQSAPGVVPVRKVRKKR